MSDLLRDAPVGQLIRWVTKNRVLQYPEEKPGFTCPTGYRAENASFSDASTPTVSPLVAGDVAEKLDYPQSPGGQSLRNAPTAKDVNPFEHTGSPEALNARMLSRTMTRPEMTKIHSRADLEEAYADATRQETMKYQQSQPIVPEKTADGIILVDWYNTDDQENPQNWSGRKKGVVVLQIYLYTLAVYMG